jgi:F-type H+-transporting ATPase subunit b
VKRLAPAAILALAPSVAFAATGGEQGGGWTFFWQVLNLALLVGVLVWFGRAPVRQYFSDRRHRVRESLDSSARLLAEAEARLADWQQKLARLDDEIAATRETTRLLAEAERERIVAEASASAERIRRDAGLAVEQEVRRARTMLRAEAAELALELAGRLLREELTADDRERLVAEFVERIERTQAPGAGG